MFRVNSENTLPFREVKWSILAKDAVKREDWTVSLAHGMKQEWHSDTHGEKLDVNGENPCPSVAL
jgi:hypothetical protein